MRTPTNRSIIPPRTRLDIAVLLALPFPACIYDPANGIVSYSNSFFNQENSIGLIELLEKFNYRFLTYNDIKILNHRIKLELKFSTRRIYYKADQVKSVEINLSFIPGNNQVLFFFNEIWSQESALSKTAYIEELVHSIAEGIALIDENDNLTFCNKSFASFFGHNINDISGLKLLHIIKPAVIPDLFLQIECLKNFQETNFEIKITNDKERVFLVHATPRTNKENKYNGAFFTFMEITERVEIEKELIIAKDKALEADRLKSAFLANMSHEIRTPMNSIIGFSTMLKNEGLEKKKRNQYLDIINNRGKHLLSILNDIIDISKIEENQIQLINENCNLLQFFDEIKEIYYNELAKQEKKEIKFLIHSENIPEDYNFITDIAHLQQIFVNLLSNAIKFTEFGVIELGTELTAEELVFYIKDSGIGIPIDKQEIIFERFRQVDDSITRSYGGTGLGLSICKGLVTLFGGKIWVNSDSVNGSTFYFTIPLKKMLLEEARQCYGIKEEKNYNWEDRRILIVEDDSTCYEFLAEVLSSTNCKHEHASSGPEALDMFKKGKYDLVLLDIQLPEIDGYQIAKIIRSSDTKIPIIAQTAHAMSDDRQKCLTAGCNDYISKPVQFEILLDTIYNYFM
jgi:PAS domain S-box-containing protein